MRRSASNVVANDHHCALVTDCLPGLPINSLASPPPFMKKQKRKHYNAALAFFVSVIAFSSPNLSATAFHFATTTSTFSSSVRCTHHPRRLKGGSPITRTRTMEITAISRQKFMPVVGYKAEKICEYYDRRPLVVGWRLNSLSLPLL